MGRGEILPSLFFLFEMVYCGKDKCRTSSGTAGCFKGIEMELLEFSLDDKRWTLLWGSSSF